MKDILIKPNVKDVVIIPDLHGKVEVIKLALNQTKYFPVFLGDYLDSFTRTPEEQVEGLQLVLDAITTGRAIGLLGNHELSYLEFSMRASGYELQTNELLESYALKDKIRSLLLPWIEINGFLVSHAGVSLRLLDDLDIDLDQYLDKNYYPEIGVVRGGFDAVGGLFWCDYRTEFKPINGVKQVFGHTAYRKPEGNLGIIWKGEGDNISYNCDCLDSSDELLVIKQDSTVEIINLMGLDDES